MLRAALDGDWVALLVSLWQSWGFCSKHALGFAAVEMEVRGELFSTSILYGHYVEGAAEVASARWISWRALRRCLLPRADCTICERIARDGLSSRPEFARQVNESRRLHEHLEGAAALWRERACPLCVPGGAGLVCRPHLLDGAKQDELGRGLAALHQRLRRFTGSMCAQKTETDPLDRFSWLETIAWFGGWEQPQRLLLERGDADEH